MPHPLDPGVANNADDAHRLIQRIDPDVNRSTNRGRRPEQRTSDRLTDDSRASSVRVVATIKGRTENERNLHRRKDAVGHQNLFDVDLSIRADDASSDGAERSSEGKRV